MPDTGMDVLRVPALVDDARASGFAAGLEAAAQAAVEHGAVCFAEPRPCDCKPGCAMVVASRAPFAPVIRALTANQGDPA